MSFFKRAAAVSILSLTAANVVADPGSPDCSRYRLYGLIPGMTPRDVRETMGERGTVRV